MNEPLQYNPQHAAALRAVLIEEARMSRHSRQPGGGRLAIASLAAGLVIGAFGATGAVWAATAPSTGSVATGSDPSVVPDYYTQLARLQAMIGKVADKHPDAYAWTWFDESALTVHVVYWTGANAKGTSAFVDEIQAIKTTKPLEVELNPTPYNISHLEQLASDISKDANHRWSDYFGAQIAGTYVDNQTGTIMIAVNHLPSNSPTTTPDGSPVSLAVGSWDWQVGRK